MDIISFLQQEYVINRRSTHNIGKQIGVGGITIHRWLKKFGIQTRTVQQGIRTRHNLDLIDDTLSDEEEGIIRGSIMGDGGLYTRNGKTANFSEGHGLDQKKYLKWKALKLQRLQPRFAYPISKKTGKTECRIDTSFFESLEKLRREYYIDKKYISREVLDKLTPLGLAIWYMDDAHKIKGGGVRLLTCAFSVREQNSMIRYFKERWQVTSKIEWSALYDNGVRYPYLKFLVDEAEKLINIIEPYIVKPMLYKIANRGRYESTNVPTIVQ
jgi:recombination protein RecA